MLKRLRVAASTAYHTATDYRYRQFNAQRRILDPDAREAAAREFARKLPHSPEATLNLYGEEILSLRRDGWFPLGMLVNDNQLAEIKDHFDHLPARDPYRPELGTFRAPAEVPPQTHVAYYDEAQIVAAPHLLALANDARVLAIVEGFLGARPTLAAIRVWWSVASATGEPEHAELFHRDVDDLRFVKLFVYLTDVDHDTGPHIYVLGSHRDNRLTAIRRYSDDEVVETFGEGAIRSLTGRAGTAFLESTYGMHRGQPPRAAPRLIFQPLYTLRPVLYGPKSPLADLASIGQPLDHYVNRVFLRSG